MHIHKDLSFQHMYTIVTVSVGGNELQSNKVTKLRSNVLEYMDYFFDVMSNLTQVYKLGMQLFS